MIDFHCHLDLYPAPHAVVQQCVARKLYILSVTTTPSAWEGTTKLAGGATRIRTALGLHPQLAHERYVELDLFDALLPQVKYVGEVGLDGGKEFAVHWSRQQAVFAHVLQRCAHAGGRILSLHSRHAASPVLDALAKHSDAGIGILHWFSGTPRELQRAIDSGCWFSVGPSMLASNKGRQLVAAMPPDRILTESDGPFAQVEGRAAWPWDVMRATEGLAALWREPIEAAQARLTHNLHRLVRQLG